MSDNITILAGGVGGSKLVDGVHKVVRNPEHLTVIGNTGDDIERHGLWVSPDMDILTYTLAGLVDQDKGWGLSGDTFNALKALERLGVSTWMNLGDQDLATHIYRTHLRKQGERPTDIALSIARHLGVESQVIPPTDEPLTCLIRVEQGWMSFQEFYLREQCRPEILDVQVAGSGRLEASPEAMEAIESAGLILIAPSNPVASIMPILSVNPLRTGVQHAACPRIAVCPVVGGKSLKGPTDRMLKAKGFDADPVGVATWYRDLIDALVIDEQDAKFREPLEAMGVLTLVTNTVMKSEGDRVELAEKVMEFAKSL